VIATIPNPGLGPLSVYTDEAIDAISSSAVEAGYLLHSHYMPWQTEPTQQQLKPERSLSLELPNVAHTPSSAEVPRAEGATQPEGEADSSAADVPTTTAPQHTTSTDARASSLPSVCAAHTLGAPLARTEPPAEHNPNARPEQPGRARDDAVSTEASPAIPRLQVAIECKPLDSAPTEQEASRLGALVFRKPGVASLCAQDCRAIPADSMLVVLLVGESATHGVDRVAFDAAVRLLPASEDEQGKELLLLGPFFSGSARSLWKMLPKERTAKIITGSATANNLYESELGPNQTLARMLVPDGELMGFLIQKLREKQTRPKIAVLRERGTQYAAGIGTKAGDDQGPMFRAYGFPMQLARLRSAHATSKASNDERLSKLRRSLDVDLSSVHPPGADDMPTFSKLTPLSVEATLRSTFASIARWSADYLLIVATDPADLIFLAGEARTYVPGAQLITLSSSALYSHAAFSTALSGALVVSSYPLGLDGQSWQRFCSNGEWQCDKPSVLPTFKSFASDSAQGIYNAMHWMIRESDRSVEPTPQPDRSVPYSASFATRPWLSLIEGHAWPLDYGEPVKCHNARCLDLEKHSSRPLQDQPTASQPHSAGSPFVRPTNLATGWALSICGAIFFVGFLSRLARRPTGNTSVSPYVRAFAEPTSAPQLTIRQYQAVAYLCLGLLGIMVWIVALDTFKLSYLRRAELGFARSAMLFVVLAALPCGASMLLWWAINGVLRGYHSLERKALGYGQLVQHFVTALIAILFSVAAYCLLSLGVELWGSKDALLLTRLSDPLGACPIGTIILLAAGLYFWASAGLARAGALARFSEQTPLESIGFTPRLRLSELTDKDEPGLANRVMTWEIGLACALIAPALLFWSRLAPSFEWDGYDATVKLLLLMLASAVIFACLQASLFWSRLRRALQDHAATFMIEAYNRIATKVSGSFGLQLRSHVPPPSELTASVQSLEQLCAGEIGSAAPESEVAGKIASKIAKNKAALRERLDELKNTYKQIESNARPTAEQERAVHTAFFRASNEVFKTLRDVWDLRASGSDTEALKDISVDNWVSDGRLNTLPTGFVLAASLPPQLLLWIRAAEDFVAMRFTTWIYHVIDQIRWLLTFALFGGLMLISAAFAYPIQPHRFVAVFCGGVLVIAAIASLRIIWQFQSNEILRRLTPGSKPAFLHASTIQQLVAYVLLPVTLLASRVFPEFGDRLSAALEPVMSLLQ